MRGYRPLSECFLPGVRLVSRERSPLKPLARRLPQNAHVGRALAEAPAALPVGDVLHMLLMDRVPFAASDRADGLVAIWPPF